MNPADRELSELVARVESLPDRNVISALASPGDFTSEAMAVYESEAQRRGIRSDAVRPVAEQLAQTKRNKSARAWTFKGIGTRLYGKRSFRADGSYQTTKWIVFCFLPIIPVCSLRITREANNQIKVLEVMPVQRRQVFDTYFFVAMSWWGIAIIGDWLQNRKIPYWELLCIALLAVPALGLYVLRRRARKAMSA